MASFDEPTVAIPSQKSTFFSSAVVKEACSVHCASIAHASGTSTTVATRPRRRLRRRVECMRYEFLPRAAHHCWLVPLRVSRRHVLEVVEAGCCVPVLDVLRCNSGYCALPRQGASHQRLPELGVTSRRQRTHKKTTASTGCANRSTERLVTRARPALELSAASTGNQRTDLSAVSNARNQCTYR